MTNDAKRADRIKDNRFWVLVANAFRLRCPVCKEGKIFSGWFTMATHCPVCGVRLERAPGDMLGSIYFNYGTTGVITTVSYVCFRFIWRVPDAVLISALACFTVLFPMFFFRYARSSFLVFDQFFSPRTPDDEGARD